MSSQTVADSTAALPTGQCNAFDIICTTSPHSFKILFTQREVNNGFEVNFETIDLNGWSLRSKSVHNLFSNLPNKNRHGTDHVTYEDG